MARVKFRLIASETAHRMFQSLKDSTSFLFVNRAAPSAAQSREISAATPTRNCFPGRPGDPVLLLLPEQTCEFRRAKAASARACNLLAGLRRDGRQGCIHSLSVTSST